MSEAGTVAAGNRNEPSGRASPEQQSARGDSGGDTARGQGAQPPEQTHSKAEPRQHDASHETSTYTGPTATQRPASAGPEVQQQARGKSGGPGAEAQSPKSTHNNNDSSSSSSSHGSRRSSSSHGTGGADDHEGRVRLRRGRVRRPSSAGSSCNGNGNGSEGAAGAGAGQHAPEEAVPAPATDEEREGAGSAGPPHMSRSWRGRTPGHLDDLHKRGRDMRGEKTHIGPVVAPGLLVPGKTGSASEALPRAAAGAASNGENSPSKAAGEDALRGDGPARPEEREGAVGDQQKEAAGVQRAQQRRMNKQPQQAQGTVQDQSKQNGASKSSGSSSSSSNDSKRPASAAGAPLASAPKNKAARRAAATAQDVASDASAVVAEGGYGRGDVGVRRRGRRSRTSRRTSSHRTRGRGNGGENGGAEQDKEAGRGRQRQARQARQQDGDEEEEEKEEEEEEEEGCDMSGDDEDDDDEKRSGDGTDDEEEKRVPWRRGVTIDDFEGHYTKTMFKDLQGPLAEIDAKKADVRNSKHATLRSRRKALERELWRRRTQAQVEYECRREAVEEEFKVKRAKIMARYKAKREDTRQKLMQTVVERLDEAKQRYEASAIDGDDDARERRRGVATRRLRRRGQDHMPLSAEEVQMKSIQPKAPMVVLELENSDIFKDLRTMGKTVSKAQQEASKAEGKPMTIKTLFDNQRDQVFYNDRWYSRGARVTVDVPTKASNSTRRVTGIIFAMNHTMVWVRVTELDRVCLKLSELARGVVSMRHAQGKQ